MKEIVAIILGMCVASATPLVVKPFFAASATPPVLKPSLADLT